MRAQQIMDHFQQVGTWVDWDRTCDLFLFGNPEVEVSGIATAWIPTNHAIQEASEAGCNLFITHEPAFYPGYEEMPTTQELIRKKEKLLEECGMTLMRIHDTWDRMPKVGIPDAWASHLGFRTEERPLDSFYKICLLDGLTVEATAQHVLEKIRPLGQDTVLVFGDRKKRVNRMAIGTGAITVLPFMHELSPDVILATDDGMNFWTGGHWAVDIGCPVIIVNHATSEKPGMQAMATYLNDKFPDVPAHYFDVAFPYSSVSA